LEDAAVADDPLLHMRLGLPLSLMARVTARTRRSLKSIGRWTADHGGWPLAVLIAAICTPVVALTQSIALASLMASPCAFALGIVVACRRRPREATPTYERRRHLGQST
jgi:hypothetical protein